MLSHFGLLIRKVFTVFVLFFACSLSFSATSEDPWEGYNRAMFGFNDGLDSVLLKPVAKGYKSITPQPVQKGVSNFFSNLGEIRNIANNLLQGKWDQTASSTFRFLINSTAGWLGIFDVASELGLQQAKEDFGQTLGYWGVNSGPYLVLPLFGPSTVRDTSGLAVDYINYDAKTLLALQNQEEWALIALGVVEVRAGLLSAESLIFGDRYSFIRDIYLQSRDRAIRDGAAPVTVPTKVIDDATDDSSWGEEDSWGAEDSWGEEDSWGDTDDSWADPALN